MNLLAVAVGGAIGATARFLVSETVKGFVNSSLPWATFAVNVMGCFAAGLLVGCFARGSISGDMARLFVMTGVLGGFTTFSAFGVETIALMNDGKTSYAIMNAIAAPLAALGATMIGWRLTMLA